jgi:hypothetical protein
MTYQGSLNAVVFLRLLTKLIEGAGRKILRIADPLQAHQTPEVLQWLQGHQGRIEVFYLPTYSPALHPLGYLNNDLKGAVNKAGLPDDRGTSRARIVTFMEHLANVPKPGIRYFLHPWVQYAAPVELL